MLKILEQLARMIGNTPLVKLRSSESSPLFAKLEYCNFSGSSKDRGAYSIIYQAVLSGKINADTTIIASSSGNFAIALASICKLLKIKFIPVIDPNINPDYETFLNLICHRVIKVHKLDYTGGYLLTRIEKVSQLCAEIENSLCADQYNDINNYKGYFQLAWELLKAEKDIKYIFIPVSSGGAITGISTIIKRENPSINIIGVDVKGSVIFGALPEKRYISGIGSSQVPQILKDASIDDVMHVSQLEIIAGCCDLLDEQAIFAGASSGAAYFASKKYLSGLHSKGDSILVFPDKGSAYLDTIYNDDWKKMMKKKMTK